jgi:hypothetical protein
MSNNIHDTNIYVVKTQVDSMINDMLVNKITDEETLKEKYQSLHQISKTLFTFIHKDITNKKFDKTSFEKNLNEMLKLIFKIQKKEITQDKASEFVGNSLAQQYIPESILKDVKK